MKMVYVTGERAIHYAEALGVPVQKQPADGEPVELVDIQPADAREVLKTDPMGICLQVSKLLLERVRSACFWAEHAERSRTKAEGITLEQAQSIAREVGQAIEAVADALEKHDVPRRDALKRARELVWELAGAQLAAEQKQKSSGASPSIV